MSHTFGCVYASEKNSTPPECGQGQVISRAENPDGMKVGKEGSHVQAFSLLPVHSAVCCSESHMPSTVTD